MSIDVIIYFFVASICIIYIISLTNFTGGGEGMERGKGGDGREEGRGTDCATHYTWSEGVNARTTRFVYDVR